MERELPRSRRGSGRALLFAPERTKLEMRLANSARASLEALRLEPRRPAPPQPRPRAVALRRPEPVALLDAPEPGADPVQHHPDLSRLPAAVLAADVVEPDLLHEVSPPLGGLACLDGPRQRRPVGKNRFPPAA
jgi:hypothetical protein